LLHHKQVMILNLRFSPMFIYQTFVTKQQLYNDFMFQLVRTSSINCDKNFANDFLFWTDVANFGSSKIKFDKVSPQEVAISWSAPEQDGGSPVTSFIVEKSEAGKENWQPASRVLLEKISP